MLQSIMFQRLKEMLKKDRTEKRKGHSVSPSSSQSKLGVSCGNYPVSFLSLPKHLLWCKVVQLLNLFREIMGVNISLLFKPEFNHCWQIYYSIHIKSVVPAQHHRPKRRSLELSSPESPSPCPEQWTRPAPSWQHCVGWHVSWHNCSGCVGISFL